MGGRPRSFDEDSVLDRAIELFWRDGYASTSLQALLDHMGISRQSLYNTFGDKRRLFLAALDRYIDQKGDAMLAELEAPDSGYESIRGFFTGLRERAAGTCSTPRICMIARGSMELAGDDAEVRERVQCHFERVHQAFRHTLDNAMAKGEIDPVDTDAVARHFTATLNGLAVMHKAGVAPEGLGAAVKVALSVLRPRLVADA